MSPQQFDTLLVRCQQHRVPVALEQFDSGALSAFGPLNTDIDHAIAEADARAFAEKFVARFYRRPAPVEDESPAALLRGLQRAIGTLGTNNAVKYDSADNTADAGGQVMPWVPPPTVHNAPCTPALDYSTDANGYIYYCISINLWARILGSSTF